jgi:membrane-bound serine protease (ClpP class)
MRFLGLVAVLWLGFSHLANAEKVCLVKVSGAIGPATATFLSRAVDQAKSQGAACLIVQLDTPGGLLDLTQKIVQSFLGARVPVVVYVAPMGATAASAGCFITLAADVAAMAPATTIGAAHPVALGGAPGGEEAKPDQTMMKKLENFSVSYIQAIAARRNRNVEWAESAVRESASITAEKARDLKVIELIAKDLDDLLRQLNGRVVNGKPLRTDPAQVVEIRMSPVESAFQMLWRPEVMFLLMLVAIYGLIGEVTSPGAILPGVVGAIALVLALYMAAILPVNIAGLLLIAVSVGLFIIDAFAPTHGILTGGGIVAFLVGSLMLFNRSDPLFRLSLAYIIPGVIVTAAFFVFIVGKGVRAQRLPVKVGKETMLGRIGSALTPIDSSGGKIFVDGEYWTAVSDTPVEKGKSVQVTGIQGLTLTVKPET